MIDGKLAPKTRVEHSPLFIPRLQEMGEDGLLRWGDRRKKDTGAPENTGETFEPS